ncbi:MAG TPA: hypothetical protein VML56_00185 [Burkholderiales bacterium]|nr:hypothetical protein [Burkholderiales bacterium]
MRRGALHYILIGAALGLAIPLVFRFVSTSLERFEQIPDAVWIVFDYLQLMLWPTLLLLIPVEEPSAPDLSSWGTVAVAALANVSVYAALAGLVWVGMAKSRWILLLPLLVVVGIWVQVWVI